ncbi:MAG: hypothetical protein HKP43_07765 [Altererythrobacter sp.]|nr:hypothetical protein [Altererythrobacter sp.]NNE50064.1 hypothetical protein [Altererythrobacter sp.]NNF94959.1 hypothetical protein [Altererythrobacter sp.]NNK46502.1 hypothetical protein [Altererythrobacter sp.]
MGGEWPNPQPNAPIENTFRYLTGDIESNLALIGTPGNWLLPGANSK